MLLTVFKQTQCSAHPGSLNWYQTFLMVRSNRRRVFRLRQVHVQKQMRIHIPSRYAVEVAWCNTRTGWQRLTGLRPAPSAFLIGYIQMSLHHRRCWIQRHLRSKLTTPRKAESVRLCLSFKSGGWRDVTNVE